MSPPAQEVILYSTSCPGNPKTRADITWIRHILDAKGIPYEEVDLACFPYRRRDMLASSDGDPTIPQLHINGRFIGGLDKVQEYEDWGELGALLHGASPRKLAEAALAEYLKQATPAGKESTSVDSSTVQNLNTDPTDGTGGAEDIPPIERVD